MPTRSYVSLLRNELSARNASYAALHHLPHVVSYGEVPVVVYQSSPCGTQHGNFVAESYRALQRRPQWKRRFEKVHSHAGRAFPKSDCGSLRGARFLNEFRCLVSEHILLSRLDQQKRSRLMVGTEMGDLPEFGFKPRIPLTSGFVERTEIDMKLGPVLFEAKLTESAFQTQKAAIVEGYRDLQAVFDCPKLPRQGRDYVPYQLLRNVLAAHALNVQFCVLLDARPPDLLEHWYRIMKCIRSTGIRTRCKVLTWQELACYLLAALQRFLDVKYGIVLST